MSKDIIKTEIYVEKNKVSVIGINNKEYISLTDFANPEVKNKIKDSINKMYEKYNGKLAISGISDYRQETKNGIDLRKFIL